MRELSGILCVLTVVLALIPMRIQARPAADDVEALIVKAEGYIDNGQIKQAEELLLQLDGMQSATSDSLSVNYAKTLKVRGYLYYLKGNFPKSDDYYLKALNVLSDMQEENSVEYARALIGRSVLHTTMYYFDHVEEYLQQALTIIENRLGVNNFEYVVGLGELGNYYVFSMQLDKAMETLERADTICRNTRMENHEEYAHLLLTFGNYCFFRGDYQQAATHYSKSKEILQSQGKKNHPYYLLGLLAKTSVDAGLGNYTEAERDLLEGLDMANERYGEEYLNYAGALSNLGGVYYLKQDFAKAEQTLKESLRISEKFFGKKHSYYFNALNALALVYSSIGAYELAEPLYIESLSLRKELYGENSPSVFNAMNNIALHYTIMGNYEKAEQITEKALVGLKLLNMEGSTIFAGNLSLKAELLSMAGRNAEALQCYEKAGDILKNKLGENHTSYIMTLSNMLLEKIECYGENATFDIEKSWLDILEKWRNAGNVNSTSYYTSVNNLASYYSMNQEYEKSRNLLLEAAEAMKNNSNDNSLLFSMLIWNLAANEGDAGNMVDAQEYYDNYFILMRLQLLRFFSFLSEKERELYIASVRQKVNDFHSVCHQYTTDNAEYIKLAFDCELLSKGLLLNSAIHLQQSINNSNDMELKDAWAELKSIKNNLFLIEKEEQSDEIRDAKKELEEQAGTLEKKILAASKEYNMSQKDFFVEWEDVKEVLSDNEAVVEFMHFNVQFSDTGVKDTIYSALFLASDIDVGLIRLASAHELRAAIQKTPQDYTDLYQLIWKPLENVIKDKSDIYLVPSGLLHGVSFDCLNHEGRFAIHNILSAKDISKIKANDYGKSSSPEIVLFGGIDYSVAGADPDELMWVSDNSTTALTRSIMIDSDQLRGQGFSYLQGTKKEVQAIESVLTSLGWKVNLFIDKYATKGRFKSYSSFSSPDVLHISTHGFYYPKPPAENKKRDKQSENPYKMSDNPLIRSGLAFAGANDVWGQKKDDANSIDGVLTAYEVSNMDLRNTKLVVLSACGTGLGDIAVHEGIYGLQRAFRMAGVQSMIVSLWDISDVATSEFMIEFYSSWKDFNRYTIRTAFSKARDALKKKYPESPEVWGAFVLIE